MNFQIIAAVVAIIGLIAAGVLYRWILNQPEASEHMQYLGGLIKNGANAFLKKEYIILSRFVIVLAIIIFLFLPAPIWKGNIVNNLVMALSYIFGSVLSGIAGKIGIAIATIANVKTAHAAKKGIGPAFLIGFRGGSVMGLSVVGLSLIGAVIIYTFTGSNDALLGFSFGASSLALFAKAGGGIFTKTADIAADYVGKVELGIPEDDPRNPAVIADNVGDNVGDVAGMGADLFDSNIASLSAAIILGASIDKTIGGNTYVNIVFIFSALGLLASIIGIIFSKIGKDNDPSKALNRGNYLTTILFGLFTAIITYVMDYDWRIWGAVVVGLLAGTVIGIGTDYFTNDQKKPVRNCAKSSMSGPAFTILNGSSYAFLSVLPALIGIGVASFAAYKLTGSIDSSNVTFALFGIAMAATGMLSIVGMVISNDAYGPIVDNSRGLAEMDNLGEEVLTICDRLDSAGNTVKAITKGFSIGAAGLTVIALLATFQEIVKDHTGEMIAFDVMNPMVFFGMLIGLAIPAVFSAMLILGVEKNAQRMVAEIHRQFDEIPGLKEGKKEAVPEYDKCIQIATVGAIKELIPAGLMAIVSTLIVGFIGGVSAIGGFLVGNIMSGLLLALYMSNAGGLWDNTKKYIESGECGGKGSAAHKAAVIGDTVGDPYKDTAGPSINTQITVVSLVASLAAILFINLSIF